jgi:hypothetical protein
MILNCRYTTLKKRYSPKCSSQWLEKAAPRCKGEGDGAVNNHVHFASAVTPLVEDLVFCLLETGRMGAKDEEKEKGPELVSRITGMAVGGGERHK